MTYGWEEWLSRGKELPVLCHCVAQMKRHLGIVGTGRYPDCWYVYMEGDTVFLERFRKRENLSHRQEKVNDCFLYVYLET